MVEPPGPDHPNCIKCGLYKTCNSPFMGADGKETASVLYIGESPGKTEDRKGIPFVGQSGQMLRGVVEEDLFIEAAYTNAVRCHLENNAKPSTKHLKLCGPFLQQDLDRYKQAKIVVLLGNYALRSVLGYNGIMKWRGRQIAKDGRIFMPILHPAAVLPGRGDEVRFKEWADDMYKVADVLSGEIEKSADSNYDYALIKTLDAAEKMFSEIKASSKCAFDMEFKWLKAFKPHNTILMASFAIKDKAWALPLMHPQSPFNETEVLDVLEMLEDFALDESIGKVGHNIKIDHLVLKATLNTDLYGVRGDTMLLSQLVDSRGGIHSLSHLSAKYLGMAGYDSDLMEYVETHPEADYKKGGDYSAVPLDVLWPYAAKDAAATWLLEPILEEKLDRKQKALYRQLLVPCSTTFTRMEANGCQPDKTVIAAYRELYERESEKLQVALRQDPDVKKVEKRLNKDQKKGSPAILFNPNSPDQVREVLYKFKKHEPTVFTPTKKPSVAATVLEGIEDPWLDIYREWKLYSSALSKYLTKMPAWIDADGRIRSSYNITGTQTGRTSSEDPNLQNIPTPEKEPGTLLAKYPIKNCFTCTWKGGYIYSNDFSAIEMRMMAALSQSKAMMRMFQENRDPHTFVTARLKHITEEEVTPEQRHRGKAANWTMIFGGGWPTLARKYRLSESEAKELEAGWYSIFPEVLEFYADTVEFTKEHGYSVSPLGRRRYISYIKDAPTEKMRRRAEREAANHPIQSSASDLLLMSIVIIDSLMQLHRMQSLIINAVHDSIVFDVYPGELDDVHEMCTDVMENLPVYVGEYMPEIDLSWVTVPLVAKGEYGTHYGSLKPYGGE